MGDFNAKIGKGKQGEVVGSHGLGERNERGERLVEFCMNNKLIVCKIRGSNKDRIQSTFGQPQTEKRKIK